MGVRELACSHCEETYVSASPIERIQSWFRCILCGGEVVEVEPLWSGFSSEGTDAAAEAA